MKRFIIIGLLMSLVLSLSARTFEKGEVMYINVNQHFDEDAAKHLDWSKDGAVLYLYVFYGGSSSKWLSMTQVDGALYQVTFDAQEAYTQCIVVRKNPADAGHTFASGVWTQTGNINLIEGYNYLYDFNGAYRWKMYVPAASAIPSVNALKSEGVTEETVHICPSALGSAFSLKAKLNSAKTAYVYSNVHGHAWFVSTDGTTWTSLDGYAGVMRDGEELIDTLITLPAVLPANGIYYYLRSNGVSGKRLVHLIADADKCELDCEITSFETAISAVNADDNTYTLDGMVAFGIPNGKLVIECDGQSVTIDSPKSPQSFSLTKVPAATENGKTTTARAYFEGDQTNCSKTITVKVPNAKEAIQEIRIDLYYGEDTTLIPLNADSDNVYVWLLNEDTLKDAPQILIPDTFHRDTTLVFTYKEYYPASGSMEDLMSNGSYEDETANYGQYGKVSTISDYNFWGQFSTPVQFYTDTSAGGVNPDKLTSNGFAVVRDAADFAPTYARVKARDGNNMALIDAVTGAEGGNKRAWYATTAMNPKLKLLEGTTYVLSFWAANINNYGEMDNAARFVFRIEYNGKTWTSGVLDLSRPEFRNNIWHQHSETFYAAEDCDNVTISVVNLNTNTLNIGNDFALDDIQFHPISSVSRVVKSHQKFIVNIRERCYDDLMYSKWNDVLFINNADHRFVSYQWYDSDVLMPGETQQRLYDPNGLKGLYYCRMTTTDGQSIRTCAYRFNEVPRSADASQQTAPGQVIRRYRVTPHVYIIQEQTGDRIETRKIITNNE